MNAIAIVQARMGSTRLPGKVLANICGQPLIERLIHRVGSAPGIDCVVVATTTSLSDDILFNWCVENSVPVFRGSSEDVLDRFWQCAQKYKPNLIVRVTADDPLKDPSIIGKALELCESLPGVDYVSNTLHPTYPEGLDIEVVRYHALERAASCAKLNSDREHVTPYIWRNPDSFVLHNFSMDPDLSHWRWTVDKPADLAFVRLIYGKFFNQPLVDYRSVISWLEDRPNLLKINSETIRNEGYIKSISQENCPWLKN